jgi:hypothetical protein
MLLDAKARGEAGRGGFARKGAMQSTEGEVEDGVNLRSVVRTGAAPNVCANFPQRCQLTTMVRG